MDEISRKEAKVLGTVAIVTTRGMVGTYSATSLCLR